MSQSELIFHHYPMSPFAHKLRLVLGYKGLAWRSVHIPVVMPKPDVVALTGGYRRTPLLQIGADVYCDSALIARVLDRLHPEPPLYPADAPLAQPLAQWADSTLFWTMIPYVMQPAGAAAIFAGQPPEALKAFASDRAAFSATLRPQRTADATVALKCYLASLDAQFADGRAFLFGPRPSIADFSLAHNLWFIQCAQPVAGILAPYERLLAGYARVAAFGEGRASPLDSAEALRIAAAASGHAPVQVEPGLGYAEGQPVTVAATDYGVDPAAGKLVGLSADEVVLEREDERAGVVHVHFPRIGFQIRKQEAKAS